MLKDVSFTVRGGEKIGIVGRTGSGKSSLALSFFRFIEPRSGNISIDGVNINTLSLKDLRSRLTIVAQEAALFKGSLRFNLGTPSSLSQKHYAPLLTPSIALLQIRSTSIRTAISGMRFAVCRWPPRA